MPHQPPKLLAERRLYIDWLEERSLSRVLPSVGQKRLVMVGATGMVGGYALRYALDHAAG